MRKTGILTALAVVALAAPAPAVQPASTADAWLAWTGCWRAEGDTGDGALCIIPHGSGVRLLTLKGSEIQSESHIVANGQPRTVSQEGCTGTETARWSADGKRLFVKANLRCGNNTMREVSGIWSMLDRTHWVRVESIGSGQGLILNAVRYVETSSKLPELARSARENRMAIETARISAAAQINLADVQDAAQHAETQTVEAWLTMLGQEFNLNGSKLVALADAGVPPSVIDVLVALSNPQKFAVREETTDTLPRRSRMQRALASCFDNYWYDPYDPFNYRDARFLSNQLCQRNGWGFYPTYGGYWGGGNRVIVIAPIGTVRSSGGRVTREGYRAPRETSAPSSSSATKTPSSSSGSSDTGSSSSSGRKAKPRDN